MIPIDKLLGPIKDENTMEIRSMEDPDCEHFVVVNKKSQHGYNVKIITDKPNNEITKDCKVKVSCNCDNFQFQWAYVLFKNEGLYNPHRLVLTPPVEKNPNMVIGACKHIKLALYRAISHNVRKISHTAGEI